MAGVRIAGNRDSGQNDAKKSWARALEATGQCAAASKDSAGVACSLVEGTGQARGADGKDLEMGSSLLRPVLTDTFTKSLSTL